MKQAPPTPPLTILTVVIEKHYGYIGQQIALIDALNPGADYRLLVVDNASAGSPSLRVDDPRCTVIAGVDAANFPAEGRGSYHHAAALNGALAQVDTRHLLIIDPDFFVVRPGWIADCLHRMQDRALYFFGAPWHYLSFRKWRYFPCVHFLLIDLEKAKTDRLDFTPSIVEDRRWLNSAAAKWLKRRAPLLHSISLIESRRDTGWRLRRTFGRRGRERSEVLLPVLDVEIELDRPKSFGRPRSHWIEQLLPRRWSFLPAPGTWVDPADVQGLDQPELQSLDPETFAWRGAPFAFHMRRNMRDKGKGRTEADTLRDAADLARLLQRTMALATPGRRDSDAAGHDRPAAAAG